VSYLERPRLHFSGSFETDVSTVNNDPTHFNVGTFKPEYDLPQTPGSLNGWWNPAGSAMFRIFDTHVRSVCYQDGTSATTPGDDPVLAMQLADAGDRVPAKLVDLDSEQQMVSQIWGMRLRLMTPGGEVAFSSSFVVAPFCEIWTRAQGVAGDGKYSAVYQSQLVDVTWQSGPLGTFLDELRKVAQDGPLSVRFVVDAYHDHSAKPNFRIGRIAGTIGVARTGEPVHVTRGRQLFSSAMMQPTFPVAPPYPQFCNAIGYVDRERGRIVLDVGNAIPTNTDFTIKDVGAVRLGVTVGGAFQEFGEIDYRSNADWYTNTVGVVDIPAEGSLSTEQLDALRENPLTVMGTGGDGKDTVLAGEANGGTYVRADDFVVRMSPGDEARVMLYATRYGEPLPYADIACFDDTQNTLGMGAPNPNVGQPIDALAYPATVTTNADGIAALPLAASAPNNPRVYIDGQVYGVRPVLATTHVDANGVVNPMDFVSVFVFDEIHVPDRPTWYDDVQPILQQYANLYPVMRQVLDLGDYESVVAHASMLRMVFSLPVEDPNYMPVTRDLSPAKRTMILRWLENPVVGEAPPLGTVQTAAGPGSALFEALAAAEPVSAEEHVSGKTAFIAQKSRGEKR